jgi:hypothetical protein
VKNDGKLGFPINRGIARAPGGMVGEEDCGRWMILRFCRLSVCNL